MTESNLPLIMALCSAGSALLVAVLLLIRMDRMQRALRRRLAESERRTTETQSRLTESINAVTQLTASMTERANSSSEQRIGALGERLETRLSQSLHQVNTQLEQVYKGLGEVHSLTGNVEGLKKVLSGVKTRGIWGEVELGALLEQQLTASQYLVNTPVVPGSSERVEYAIRLPGRNGDGLLLPIDSKFPMEPYQRLLDACERGEREAADRACAELARAVTEQGKKIRDKYVKPPLTTDFALMFLPIESLYAEVLRIPGLAESLQEKYRVVLSGPSTLSALLGSLQLGFRTVSIEQRTGEVWEALGQLQAEFGQFTESLDKVRQRLDQASAELDTAVKRSRAVSRRLDALSRPED